MAERLESLPPDIPAGGGRRILVVEDDDGIRTLLGATLRMVGYEVRGAADGRQALAVIERFQPHLLVVDVMLPDMDGFELTCVLRAADSATPVVFLTARAETADRIAGLRAGADDYVTKPFNVDELLLRIGAVLDRSHPPQPTDADRDDGVLRYADLTLDARAHEVRRAGQHIWLTPTEMKLLAFLMSHANQIVTRLEIIERVWGYDFAGDLRIVETYIRYLRRKIDHFDPPLIHTVRGVGFSLRLPRAPSARTAE